MNLNLSDPKVKEVYEGLKKIVESGKKERLRESWLKVKRKDLTFCL
jgi:hypothetical protein